MSVRSLDSSHAWSLPGAPWEQVRWSSGPWQRCCIISGCVMHVGAMSGHGNTWGHVRCLRRGPRAGAGVVFLVPVKVFCRGLGFASVSECVGLCRLCQGMLGHVVSLWGVSKHTELCLWALPLLSGGEPDPHSCHLSTWLLASSSLGPIPAM